MKKIILMAILLIFTVIIFSGCFGVQNGDAPLKDASVEKQQAKSYSEEKLIEPCMLVTKAEAEQFIGESLKDAEKSDNEAVGTKICIYNAANVDSFRFLQVTVAQETTMSGIGQTPELIYKAIKDNFENAVTVDGIGDNACIAPPGLHILKGAYYITIAVGNSDDEKNREILMAAGKKAVENLAELTDD